MHQIEDVLKKYGIENNSLAVDLFLLLKKEIFNSRNRKVTWEQLNEIRRLRDFEHTIEDIARKYNISTSSVRELLKL